MSTDISVSGDKTKIGNIYLNIFLRGVWIKMGLNAVMGGMGVLSVPIFVCNFVLYGRISFRFTEDKYHSLDESHPVVCGRCTALNMTVSTEPQFFQFTDDSHISYQISYETTFETTCKISCAVTSRLITRGLSFQPTPSNFTRRHVFKFHWSNKELFLLNSALVLAQLVLQVVSNVVSYACLAVSWQV